MVFLLVFSLLLSGAFVSSQDVDDIHGDLKFEEFDIYPTNYKLWLNLGFFRDSKVYTGNLKINVTSKVPVSQFSIDCGGYVTIGHIGLLESDKINVRTEIDSSEEAPPRHLKYNHNKQSEKVDVLVIGSALEPFINYIITISFSGRVSNEISGIFQTDYFVNHSADQNRSYVATNFLPKSASTVFPCFENVAFKSTFKVSILHNKKYTVISNTPGMREHYFEEDFRTSFEETPPISIHSLGFILTELNSKSLEGNGTVKYTIYAEDSVFDETEYLFNKSEMIMSKVEDYLGMKYPLKKIDLYVHQDTSITKFQMEDIGLVSVLQRNYSVNPNAISFAESIKFHSYVVQLFLRQYLGNIVTPLHWSDYWILKGLAKYIQFELLEEIVQNDHLVDWLVLNDLEIHKGEAIFRMLRNIIGKDTFKKAIQNFIQENKFKGVNIDEMYSAFNNALQQDHSSPDGFDLKSFIESWTNKLGYPILNVNRDYITGKITLTQNQFLSYDSKHNVTENTPTWWLPYNFVSKGDHDYTITKPTGFMENIHEKEFNPHVSNEDWIIFNKKRTYKYFVNYDVENWNMISKELNDGDFEKIHYLNRAQLINDAYFLAKNGYLDYKILFNLLTYIKHENNYVVWKTVDIILEDILTVVHQRTELLIYLDKYVQISLYVLYDKYSMETDNVDEAAIKSYLTKWLCYFQNHKCIEDTKTASDHVINSLLYNTPTKINPSLYHNILCSGVSDEKYTKFWHDIANASYTTRSSAINSLPCNLEKKVFENFLLKVYTKQTLQPEFDQAEENRISFYIKNNYFTPNVASAIILNKPALLFDVGNEKNLIEYLNSTLNNAHVSAPYMVIRVFNNVRLVNETVVPDYDNYIITTDDIF